MRYAVMTVAERADHLGQLLGRFKQAGIEPEVVVDEERTTHAAAARRAWERIGWGVVLEDDVQLCDHFFDRAAEAITARPDEIISFFNVGKGIGRAVDGGFAWAVASHCAWNQALYHPPGVARAIMDYGDLHVRSRWWDDVMNVYCLQSGRRIYCTAPCLVEHHHGRSVSGNPSALFGKPRLAGRFNPAGPPRGSFQNLATYPLGGNTMKAYAKVIV